MPRRTIVQIVPSLVVGGAERMATWLAEAEAARGHDVHVVCVTAGGPLLDRLPPELRRRTWVAGKRARFDATVLWRLTKILERLQPDVVHTHLFTSLSWGTVAARAAGVPVVVHTQHAVHDDAHAYLPAVRRTLAPFLDAIVGCNEATVTDLVDRDYAPGVRTLAIDNGIPLAGRPTASLDGQPFHVGTVGRMVPIKGQRFLVDAIATLHREGVPVRLTLMGDGPLWDDLHAQVADLGLADVVTFAGRVDDVPDRLATLDTFVLPSLSEAMPMALLEAGAAGLPLVVTSGGGGRTLLDAGAGGAVVAPGDADALAGALRDLATLSVRKRRRLGEQSRATVLAGYDAQVMADRYLALYEDLLRA